MLLKMPSCMSRQHPKRFENQTNTRPRKWVNSSLQRGTDGPPAREVGEEVFGGTKAELVDAGIGAALYAGESGHGSLVHTVTLHGLPGCYLCCGPRFQRSRNEKGLADEYLLTLGTTGGEGGIRTRGGLLTHTRFPGVRLKPLIHLSVEPGIVAALSESQAVRWMRGRGCAGAVAALAQARAWRALGVLAWRAEAPQWQAFGKRILGVYAFCARQSGAGG